MQHVRRASPSQPEVTVSCRGSHRDYYLCKQAAADKSVCAVTQLLAGTLCTLIKDLDIILTLKRVRDPAPDVKYWYRALIAGSEILQRWSA